MSKPARAFWVAIVISGLATAVWAFANWRIGVHELPTLVFYILASLATSGFKVRLPGISSSLSLNFVVIIASLSSQHPGGGMIIAGVGVLAQTYYKCKSRPRLVHAAFNLANIWISVAASYFCVQHPLLASVDRFGVLSVVTASLAYFAVNTLLLSGIIGLTSDKAPLEVWKESYLWTAPEYMVGGIVASCFHFLVNYVGWAALLVTFPVMYLVHRSYTIYLARAEEQQNHIKEMSDLHMRTIEALAMAIDAKDDTTSAHLRRVQVYATEVAKELGLPQSDMLAIEAAALLHDIGKLAVPSTSFRSPDGSPPTSSRK